VLSAENAWSRAAWILARAAATMSITAQYLALRDRGQGTNVSSWPESSRVPGYPRATRLQEDSLAGSLERGAIGVWKALSRGHRRETAAGVDGCAVIAGLRGRRDSLRPGRPVRSPQ